MLTDLIAFLLAQAGITALVETRIYPVQRPQGSEFPAIVLQRISGAPESDDDGNSGIAVNRVQVDCYALSYRAVSEIAAAIATALSGRAFTHGATEFQSVTTEDESDTTEMSADGKTPIFRTRFDFMIWHKEI